MRSGKIIAAAAFMAFVLQTMPMQVLAEDISRIAEEKVQENSISSGTEAQSDDVLLQQVEEITEDYDLPDVGVGFIELTPEQTEAIVRAIDEQNDQYDYEVCENYKASLYTYHNDYFRDQLNTAEKELYDSWVDICADFMVSTQDITNYYPDYVLYDPDTISKERAQQIVTFAYYSYPEFFFLNNGNVTGTYGSKYLIAPYVNDNFKTGSFRSQIYKEITEKTISWMNVINKLPDDIAKEKYIADTICNTVIYKSVARLDQSLYGSLILETAVCNGYAMEMNYFCNAAGIDCITVFSDSHAWNNVCLYDDWYVVDTTWMDQKTYVWYDWFNTNTATMLNNDQNGSHAIASSGYTNITLPTCTKKLDPQVPGEKEYVVDFTSFPDETFRSYVLKNIDTDGNGSLSETEINKVLYIDVAGKSSNPGTISDLTGIEHFTNITSLNCSYNDLTTLDLSSNTALQTLFCNGNKLTSLDVSNVDDLTLLWCQNNQLTSLDLSYNTALTTLVCSNNYLTSLDLSNNTVLTTLNAADNVYPMDVVDKTYSLSVLPEDFDASKASNWSGAEYNSTTNSLKNFTSNTVTYDYDCGNGNTASFKLIGNIVIQKSPSNTTVIEGFDTSLEFAALGTDLTYQWQKYDSSAGKWVDISGATSAVLTLENVISDMNGSKYRCSISTSNASVTYTSVVLTVKSFADVTEAEVTAMSIDEAIKFVNAFTADSSDSMVLTAAQMMAIERVLAYDFSA